MGNKFKKWLDNSLETNPLNIRELREILFNNRDFHDLQKLNYGDSYLQVVEQKVLSAIKNNSKIALYADYDVDGTMSCVSWIWFFKAINFTNYIYYIPCRFTEGYGLNLNAIKMLIHEKKADLIITMDTGITANIEAEYCNEHGVEFICTDHHIIQESKMPDCTILNPKQHHDPEYQELCGCGITFVLLRKLGDSFQVIKSDVWQSLLALAGMATICDVVPLNSVNHRLARLGVEALQKSKKNIFVKLLESTRSQTKLNESDIGFKLGPRINAVGRLDHAQKVIEAFISEYPDDLIGFMEECNEKRKSFQNLIVVEAQNRVEATEDLSIIFLGDENWHQGVVGIAASKLAEKFWCPVWLFQISGNECKGSARSIPGVDVSSMMFEIDELFTKCGGHKAAAGYSFPTENIEKIKAELTKIAKLDMLRNPENWVSKIYFDCSLDSKLLDLSVLDMLDDLKPFGHGFTEPQFLITADILNAQLYNDKLTGEPRHTAITIRGASEPLKIMFFNEVHEELIEAKRADFIVTVNRNFFRGKQSVSLFAKDYTLN